MSNVPAEIALLISSFQRPRHLECALTSVACQEGLGDGLEVIVTDDGSRDDTIAVVSNFAARVRFPVKVTTHDHMAFQVARCRNDGALVSTAPYLLFSDGDCFLPRDHLALHLRHRQQNVVMAGDCCRLPEDISARLDGAAIARGDWCQFDLREELRRLGRQHRKAQLYTLMHHRTKPRLVGNNVGIWRQDYVSVNGYDEQFVGWGCEDDDLGMRLRRQGITVRSILKWTWAYHIWHPVASSCPPRWRDGGNVRYLSANSARPIPCRKGLVDLDREAAGLPEQAGAPGTWRPMRSPFAEIVFHPGHGTFSGLANWNVLVVEESRILPMDRAAAAHLILSPAETRTLLKRLQVLDVRVKDRELGRRLIDRAA
jgi:GT2 family glycosyltransferase